MIPTVYGDVPLSRVDGFQKSLSLTETTTGYTINSCVSVCLCMLEYSRTSCKQSNAVEAVISSRTLSTHRLTGGVRLREVACYHANNGTYCSRLY